MNYLYISTANRDRSRFAFEIMSELDPENNHDSAGISPIDVGVTKKDFWEKSKKLSEEMLKNADIIFVFEPTHHFFIEKLYKGKYTDRIKNLNIPPLLKYGDEKLADLFIERIEKALSKKLN